MWSQGDSFNVVQQLSPFVGFIAKREDAPVAGRLGIAFSSSSVPVAAFPNPSCSFWCRWDHSSLRKIPTHFAAKLPTLGRELSWQDDPPAGHKSYLSKCIRLHASHVRYRSRG